MALEKTQAQFTASRRKMDEVAQENLRLNCCLQEKEKCLQEFEQVKM